MNYPEKIRRSPELLIVWIVVICAPLSLLWSQNDLPPKPDSWVNDYAGVLSQGEIRALESELAGLEQRSSNQIFIALFSRMPENTYLEDFAVDLYEKWRPGLADKDNGILMVIFIQDRKIRIEVGYGLEDVMTDAQAGMIIREYIAPEFQKGNYFRGIEAALKVMIPAVEGKYKLPLPEKAEKKGFSLSTLIIGLMILLIISRIFRGPGSTGYGTRPRSGSFIGPMIFGGFGGGRSGGGFSGGGFSGGFGGMSGGGGASGSW